MANVMTLGDARTALKSLEKLPELQPGDKLRTHGVTGFRISRKGSGTGLKELFFASRAQKQAKVLERIHEIMRLTTGDPETEMLGRLRELSPARPDGKFNDRDFEALRAALAPGAATVAVPPQEGSEPARPAAPANPVSEGRPDLAVESSLNEGDRQALIGLRTQVNGLLLTVYGAPNDDHRHAIKQARDSMIRLQAAGVPAEHLKEIGEDLQHIARECLRLRPSVCEHRANVLLSAVLDGSKPPATLSTKLKSAARDFEATFAAVDDKLKGEAAKMMQGTKAKLAIAAALNDLQSEKWWLDFIPRPDASQLSKINQTAEKIKKALPLIGDKNVITSVKEAVEKIQREVDTKAGT